MTTYTVFSADDSSDAKGGLSLQEAAIRLLTADGYDYEIRAENDGKGWRLWLSRVSQNASGPRGFGKSIYFSLHTDETEATTEIFGQAVVDNWHGLEAMTDEQFARMQAVFEE